MLKNIDKNQTANYNKKEVNKMLVNYDIQKINQTLQDFYNATGINMDLLKDDFTFVGNHSFWEKTRYCKAIQSCEKGRSACRCSDAELFWKNKESKKAEKHICHAGLIDISIPLIYNDIIIGYIIFGQMKTDATFSNLKAYINSLGLSETEMNKYYTEIPTFDAAKIQSISNIAAMLVKHILLENMLKPNFDENIQRALNYISENLDKNLSIQNISKSINISKSVLYRHFHRFFNCTVSQYINKKRIEKSVDLLTKSNLSIEEIAQKVGFASGSYFSKMFKKEKGLSPLKYKSKIKRTGNTLQS